MSAATKSVKCKCGRSFATKKALTQHRMSGNCGRAVTRQGSGSSSTSVPKGAPVAVMSAVKESGTDSATVAGVDRLAHVEDISQFSHGQVVFDEVVSSSSFTRLSVIAAAYQKVKFRKIVFRVVPMLSTSINGGYVAAFVRDPADIPPPKSADLLNWITSQRGSITTKWWQSCQISVPVSDRTYYTSTSEEVREYSPGRLVLVVDGKASAKGPLTIFADWSVSLSHASLEKGAEPGKPDHTTVMRNLFTKDKNTYVWSYDPATSGDSGSPNPDKMFSDWAVGDIFMLPSAATIMEYASGTSGDSQVKNYWALHVESKTGVRWRQHPDASDSGLAAADGTLIIPRGMVLRRVEKAEVSGERLSPHGSSLEPSNGNSLEEPRGPLCQSSAALSCGCQTLKDCCVRKVPSVNNCSLLKSCCETKLQSGIPQCSPEEVLRSALELLLESLSHRLAPAPQRLRSSMPLISNTEARRSCPNLSQAQSRGSSFGELPFDDLGFPSPAEGGH